MTDTQDRDSGVRVAIAWTVCSLFASMGFALIRPAYGLICIGALGLIDLYVMASRRG